MSCFVFSFTCLNWTVDRPKYEPREFETTDVPIDIPVIRTKHPEAPKPPPPPVSKVPIFIPVEELPPAFDPNPEPKREPIKVAHSTRISKPTVPVVPPPPPPPPLKEISKEPDFWKIVEEMPRFGNCRELKTKEERQTCSDKKLLEFIYAEVKYPALARENGIEGVVVVQFFIDDKGKVSSPKIVREIGGGCGKEVLRIMKNMPDWSPGEQRGRKVKVRYNLPVRFHLGR